MKLVLSNNTEIEIKDTSTIFDVQIDISQYQYVWGQLTPNNIKLVKLVSEDGDVMDQKENLVVDSESSFRKDGKVYCHFYLREKMREEILEEKVRLLEEALGVHAGAITDLAEAVSGLVEEGGLIDG